MTSSLSGLTYLTRIKPYRFLVFKLLVITKLIQTYKVSLNLLKYIFDKRFFVGLLFLLVTQTSLAQIPTRTPGGLPRGGGSDNAPARLGQQADTGKEGNKIIDDSTKNIYGPKTTHYFFEKDIFENRKTLYAIDTNYSEFHEYSFVQRTKNQYVDLGNLGTAMRSIYFRPVSQIGTLMGYESYTQYGYAINDVRFYDTHSPFTNMFLVLGGNGQNILRFDHSQSIKPNFNIGITAQRSTSDKQYGNVGTTNAQNNLAQNWAFVFHASYSSKDNKYVFLGQFNHLNHSVLEQGGTIPDSSEYKATIEDYTKLNTVIGLPQTLANFKDIYDRSSEFVNYFNSQVGLPAVLSANASSWERRNRTHIYHQYKMAQGFQLYHVFDYSSNSNIYKDIDNSIGLKNGLYRIAYYPTKITNQDLRYRLLENKFGIKGRFRDFNYRLHYRSRVFGLTGNFNKTDSSYFQYKQGNVENFVGLWVDYYLKDSTQRLTVEAEYLVGKKDLMLRGDITTKWFDAGYALVNSSPTLLQQFFASSHLLWKNQFSNMTTNTVYGQINLRTKFLRFSPRLDYSFINDYIYFDETAKPSQYTTGLNVFRFGADFSFQKKRWLVNGQTYFSKTDNDNIIKIPTFFANLRVAFDFIFSKVLFVQIGTDIHYKSRYYADAYMPLTQQFYIQNKVQADGYPSYDVFANFRINRVKLFVKFANASYRLWGADGYYSTPFYPGMGRSFGFGVNWPLFD